MFARARGHRLPRRLPREVRRVRREVFGRADASRRPLRQRTDLRQCQRVLPIGSQQPPALSLRARRATDDSNPVHPVRNSTAVKCSAAKPAFVEKVEKAGKAALSGLAALTLAAGVRYFPAIIIPALRATVSTPAGAHRARETPEPAPDDRDRTGARLRARYGRRSRVASAVSGPASTPGLRLFFDDTRPTPGATRGQEIPKTNNARANLPFLTSPLSPSLFYRAVRPGRDL